MSSLTFSSSFLTLPGEICTTTTTPFSGGSRSHLLRFLSFFLVTSPKLTKVIYGHMLDILQQLVEESDQVPQETLDLILGQLLPKAQVLFSSLWLLSFLSHRDLSFHT